MIPSMLVAVWFYTISVAVSPTMPYPDATLRIGPFITEDDCNQIRTRTGIDVQNKALSFNVGACRKAEVR